MATKKTAPKAPAKKAIEFTGPALIRDHMAGVIVGVLRCCDLAAGTWVMAPGARKLHYWERAAAVEGVAVRGVDRAKSRMTPGFSMASAGRSLAQVALLTQAEFDALMAQPEWQP